MLLLVIVIFSYSKTKYLVEYMPLGSIIGKWEDLEYIKACKNECIFFSTNVTNLKIVHHGIFFLANIFFQKL